MTKYKNNIGLEGGMDKKMTYFLLVGAFTLLIGVILGIVFFYLIFGNYDGVEDFSTKDSRFILDWNFTKRNYERNGFLKNFSSYDELRFFLKKGTLLGLSREFQSGGLVVRAFSRAETASQVATPKSYGSRTSAQDYSLTNVQVEGVDEPDIVKNDGKYIYAVSRNGVFIIEAYPAENMKVLSTISFYAKNSRRKALSSEDFSSESVRNIFVNEDKLIVFTDSSVYKPHSIVRCLGVNPCGGDYEYFSNFYIYDIKDRSKPKLENNFSVDGYYIDARMIEDYVYVVSYKYADPDEPMPPVYLVNGNRRDVPVDSIKYFDFEDSSYQFTSISSMNVKTGDFNSEVFLTGSTSVVYVSENNIYITSREYMDYDVYQEKLVKEAVLPLLPRTEREKIEAILKDKEYRYPKISKIGKIVEDYYNTLSQREKSRFNSSLLSEVEDWKKKMEKEREKTVIHKIQIRGGKVVYKNSGKVPGHVLNQFSMDEYKGNFRIATTIGGGWWFYGPVINQSNGVYILDEDMVVIGYVDGIAEEQSERIYAVRFMGDKAFMVTFRQTDPFFVIDLSKPKNPKVLGELKIPGVSDYLHPYDKNHIIGVGRDADSEGRIKGLKISLFDVSDFKNPKEVDSFSIGDRGTSSPVLHDHKAFLFIKERDLMVIPVLVYEIYNQGEEASFTIGEVVWQGVYAFKVDKKGFDLVGKITHFGEGANATDNKINSGPSSVFRDGRYHVQRSLYLDDVLYTLSMAKVKANSLVDFKEINQVSIYQEVDEVYEDFVYPS